MSDISNTGITVNDRPLREYLEKKKIPEVPHVSSIADTVKYYLYKKPIKRYKIKKGESDKGRYLTDSEIRKEYGMEQRPLNSMVEKILWLFCQKPGSFMDCEEIAKEIGGTIDPHTLRAISIQLSKFYKILGPYVFHKSTHDITKYSLKIKNPDFDSLISEYRKRINERNKNYRDKKKESMKQAKSESSLKDTTLDILTTSEPIKVEININFRFFLGKD